MKPAPFSYRRASSIEEAVALVGEHGQAAAVLAGGQSLVVDLRMRAARPAVVVDINRVPDLDGVDVAGGEVRIGPLVRHRAFERDVLAGSLGSLLARVAPWVAHPPIRTRGTFVGSVAWGHPCAEWGAVTAGLGGRVELRSASSGIRSVGAAEWWLGSCRTARRPDEVVSAVYLPELPAGAGTGFAELRRTSASFALVVAVAAVTVEAGRVRSVRVGLGGAGSTPLRSGAAESVLDGQAPTPAMVGAAALAAADACDPVGEPHTSAAYRRHAVGELVRRALDEAVASCA